MVVEQKSRSKWEYSHTRSQACKTRQKNVACLFYHHQACSVLPVPSLPVPKKLQEMQCPIHWGLNHATHIGRCRLWGKAQQPTWEQCHSWGLISHLHAVLSFVLFAWLLGPRPPPDMPKLNEERRSYLEWNVLEHTYHGHWNWRHKKCLNTH